MQHNRWGIFARVLGPPEQSSLSSRCRGSYLDTNRVCWGTGCGPGMLDLNFSFILSEGALLDAANEDRLAGSFSQLHKMWHTSLLLAPSLLGISLKVEPGVQAGSLHSCVFLQVPSQPVPALSLGSLCANSVCWNTMDLCRCIYHPECDFKQIDVLICIYSCRIKKTCRYYGRM